MTENQLTKANVLQSEIKELKKAKETLVWGDEIEIQTYDNITEEAKNFCITNQNFAKRLRSFISDFVNEELETKLNEFSEL